MKIADGIKVLREFENSWRAGDPPSGAFALTFVEPVLEDGWGRPMSGCTEVAARRLAASARAVPSVCTGLVMNRRMLLIPCGSRPSTAALDAPDFRDILEFRRRHLKALRALYRQILHRGGRLRSGS